MLNPQSWKILAQNNCRPNFLLILDFLIIRIAFSFGAEFIDICIKLSKSLWSGKSVKKTKKHPWVEREHKCSQQNRGVLSTGGLRLLSLITTIFQISMTTTYHDDPLLPDYGDLCHPAVLLRPVIELIWLLWNPHEMETATLRTSSFRVIPPLQGVKAIQSEEVPLIQARKFTLSSHVQCMNRPFASWQRNQRGLQLC